MHDNMGMGYVEAHGTPFGSLVLMWMAMMVLMMLPGAVPAISRQTGFRPRAAFLVAYLALWWIFGLAAAAAQSWLQSSNLLNQGLGLRSTVSAGVVILAIGLYQLTPWKRDFLSGCREVDQARDFGHGIAMGLRYGASCLGSSAGLMTSMFVVGMMSTPWMAAIAVWVLAEKTLPLPWASLGLRLAGGGLIAWSAFLLSGLSCISCAV